MFLFRYSSYFKRHRDEVMKILDIIHNEDEGAYSDGGL